MIRLTLACSFACCLIGCCLVPAPPQPAADPQPPTPAVAIAPFATPLAAPPPPPIVVPAPAPGRLTRASFDAAGAVPQAPGLRELYEHARRPSTGIENGMLVCSARVRNESWDDSLFAGGADVALRARFGSGPIRSTAQSGLRTYTFPIAQLERGDTVWIRVVDIDVFSHDTIAEGSIRFEQAPFTLTMGQADVECRAVDAALVARRAAAAIHELARTIDELGEVQPDVQGYDLGYPRATAGRVVEAATAARAWTDGGPAYDVEVDRAIAFDTDWDARARRAVGAAMRTLPAPGASTAIRRDLHASVREVACGADAAALGASMSSSTDTTPGGCLVVLALDASSRVTLPALDQPDAQWEAWALDRSAHMWTARVVARSRDGAYLPASEPVVVEPGAPVEVTISLPPGATPVLLRVRDGGRPAILRLE